MSTGSSPTRSCGRKNTANPIAATAGWFEMTVEAARTTATMNAIDAATPTGREDDAPTPAEPYSTATRPKVATSGTTPADDRHDDRRRRPTWTARSRRARRAWRRPRRGCPRSRSATSRLIDGEDRDEDEDLGDDRGQEVVERIQRDRLVRHRRASGTLATTQALIAPLAAVRARNSGGDDDDDPDALAVAPFARCPCGTAGRSRRARSVETRPAARAGSEIEAVMPHAPWC